jgi:hypothetical protein
MEPSTGMSFRHMIATSFDTCRDTWSGHVSRHMMSTLCTHRRAVGTHYGPTRIHSAELSHRRNGKAGTETLHYLHIYLQTKLLQVATTGRTGLLEPEHRHHRRLCRGSSTFQGLGAGRRRRRTKPDYTATNGRLDHATLGERANTFARDSEYVSRSATSDKAWAGYYAGLYTVLVLERSALRAWDRSFSKLLFNVLLF